MTKIQIAWIAGIIEGEGCIWVGWQRNWHRTLVHVGMTDHDVIERLQKWSGFGSISAYKKRKRRKQIWVWSVQKQEEVWKLLKAITPFLGKRRSMKANDAMALLQEKMSDGGLGRGRFHRSKTECRNGHPYDKKNTYMDSRGARKCRICKNEAVKRWKMKDPEKFKAFHREATRLCRKRQKMRVA